MVRRPARAHRRGAATHSVGGLARAGRLPAGQAPRLLGRAAGLPARLHRGEPCGRSGSPSASGPRSRRSTPARRSSRRSRRTTTPPTRRRTRSARPTATAVVILGSGPNRIGQGIEFDYCCVHASMSLARRRLRDRHGQLQPRDGLDGLRHLGPPLLRAADGGRRGQRARCRAGGRRRVVGVIVSLGGQTPLKLADSLPPELVLGTSPASIDLAEDRERWNALCLELGIPQPPGGTATNVAEALAVAGAIGYPVLLRPSYVLGGRAMEIVYDDEGVRRVMHGHDDRCPGPRGRCHGRAAGAGRPLPGGCGRGGRRRRARRSRAKSSSPGSWSTSRKPGCIRGTRRAPCRRSRCRAAVIDVLDAQTRTLAEALGVCGLINVQYAVKDGQVYVLEANPRASRTVPFVAKATGVPLAMVAATGHGGPDARTAARRGAAAARSPRPGARPRPRQRQGGGAALRPFPGGRHAPRTRDALHRRGDGRGHHVRTGLRQEPDGGRDAPARFGCGLPLAGRPRQAGRARGRPLLQRVGLLPCRHARNGRVPPLARADRRHAGGQGRRGRRGVGRGRPDRTGQGAAGRQHPARTRAAGGRTAHPPGRGHLPRALPHHAGRRPAAAEGVEDARGHPLEVRPLQDLHISNDADRRCDEPARRCDDPVVWTRHPDRTGRAAQPGHDGLGHLGARGGARGVRRPVPTRRGRGEVALGRAVAGQPRTARPRRRRGHAQQRRASRSGARSVAHATSRRWLRPGLGWW